MAAGLGTLEKNKTNGGYGTYSGLRVNDFRDDQTAAVARVGSTLAKVLGQEQVNESAIPEDGSVNRQCLCGFWEVVQLVGLQTLDLAILVRVQASQPTFSMS